MPTGDGVRVVHVAEALGGGLLEIVRTICDGHVRAGMTTCVVHGRRPETPEGPLDRVLPDRVDAIEVPVWGSRSPLREPRAILRLRSILRQLQPDVVVFHSSFAGVAGIVMLRDVPTIFVPHAFTSQLPGHRARRAVISVGERAACHRHTVTASVSHSEGTVARAFGAREVRVIPNGATALDQPVWHEPPTMADPPEVIGAGRLVPQRRPIAVSRILSAVGDLADTAWVGGGGSGQYAADAATALSDAGVPLTGWLSSPAVAEYLLRAAVYVHWAAWDGLPMTVLEAIAHDAVVVASDTEPNREVLGDAGVYATEMEAIAAIRTVLTEPAAWAKAIERQRARAPRFRATRMCAEWNALVTEVAASRR